MRPSSTRFTWTRVYPTPQTLNPNPKPIIEQVDSWGWATTTIRFFGCTRLLWDFGYSAFVEWLKSDESTERLPTGVGSILATCLRIQPTARPSCAKLSHSICELLQVQVAAAGYKAEKFAPAIEPRALVCVCVCVYVCMHACTFQGGEVRAGDRAAGAGALMLVYCFTI